MTPGSGSLKPAAQPDSCGQQLVARWSSLIVDKSVRLCRVVPVLTQAVKDAVHTVQSADRPPASCSLEACNKNPKSLLNLQVQYVECIATGHGRNGQPGSLTLTGQVRGLLVQCKRSRQHTIAFGTWDMCQRQGGRQQLIGCAQCCCSGSL